MGTKSEVFARQALIVARQNIASPHFSHPSLILAVGEGERWS